MQAPGESSSRDRHGTSGTFPLVAFAALGIVAAILGAVNHRLFAADARARAESQLEAIASARATLVEGWLAERQRNVTSLAMSPSLRRAAAALALGAPDPAARTLAQALLEAALHPPYHAAHLVRADGAVLATTAAPPPAQLAGSVREALDAALAGGRLVASTGAAAQAGDEPDLVLAAPVRAEAPQVGVLLEVASPASVLSAATRWPGAGDGLVQLIRRGRGEVEHLGGSEPHRIHPVEASLVCARFAPGSTGAVAGRLHDGREAYGWVAPVPGSEWAVLALLPARSVEAPLRRRALWTTSAVLFAIALAGTLLARRARANARAWQERQDQLEQRLAERHRWAEEQRRMEVRLRESEERLSAALAASDADAFDWDLDRGRFYSGERLPRMLGLPESMEAHPDAHEILDKLVHPDDRAATRDRLLRHLAGQTPAFESEHRALLPDGRIRWIAVQGRVTARDGSGRPLRLAGTLRDVTEKRQREERLEQAERLASVGTLAGGVAHEVNNPLASVSANLDWIRDQVEEAAREGRSLRGEAAGEVRRAIDEAQQGVTRVRDIVRALQSFARPPGQRRGPVDVRREIETALSLAGNEVRHRARIVTRIDELPLLPGSEHELTQVFVNLLVNAAQSIPEGHAEENEIAIEAALSADGRVRVEVRDTGSGITPEQLPHIFDPFYTTRPVGTGAGLGLSICHGIVRSLGGEIQVESQPGRGSTFRVLLPLPRETPLRVRLPDPLAPQRRRVLVVDDDPLVARALTRVLASEHDVTACTSGAEALERIRAGERFDVVLCDLMMPEMTGMDFHDAAVPLWPELAGRIVYLTGGAFTPRSRAFVAATARPVLEKPVDPATLRALVAGTVTRHGA